MSAKCLLIIDDEPDIGALLCQVAAGFGFEAASADNPDEFWSLYDATDPVVVILDLKIPSIDGVELLRTLAVRNCKAQILIMSGMDRRVLQTALRLGKNHGLNIVGALEKPISLTDIQKKLEEISARIVPVGVTDLRLALEANQIVPYYQPKVNLVAPCGSRITGYEALARWHHPKFGVIGPDKFIGMAEEEGLIDRLTEAIFSQMLEQQVAWCRQGIELSAAINLSPHLLGDLDLPDRYERLCRSFGVDTASVTVEVTESAAMSNPSITMEILTRLRLKGFGIALDDFGTGYSSLVQLHRLPFNELKIDRSFVMESDLNDEAVTIVRAIANLARSLDLDLCAEGVQSHRALALVREIGCQTAQGYLIGRPMPQDKFVDFLARADQGVGGTAERT